jgi:regulator of protease activity HflC (stomatin/prohibitin superfamily)
MVKAENKKIAAIDYAAAKETKADGEKRSKIKEAEDVRQASIVHAEGNAEANRLVNEAANKYFIGNAQLLRNLQALESRLEINTKIVVSTGSELANIMGDMAGVVPLNK